MTACTSARTHGATTPAVACRDTNWTVTTTTALVRIPCAESTPQLMTPYSNSVNISINGLPSSSNRCYFVTVSNKIDDLGQYSMKCCGTILSSVGGTIYKKKHIQLPGKETKVTAAQYYWASNTCTCQPLSFIMLKLKYTVVKPKY